MQHQWAATTLPGKSIDASTLRSRSDHGSCAMPGNCRPEDVNLEVFFEIVAQLVTDLQAWPHEH